MGLTVMLVVLSISRVLVVEVMVGIMVKVMNIMKLRLLE